MKKRLVLLMTAAITMAAAMPAYAGTWQQDATGWWWQNDDNSYPANRWEWLDGNKDGVAECYYFDKNGYLVVNAVTPDSFQVNGDGAWVVNGVVQTQAAGDEKTLSIPDNVTVDENGTTVRYINGIPYYTYAKEEKREEVVTDSVLNIEYDDSAIAYRIVELTNVERRRVGEKELAINDELMENAKLRAEECNEKFGHIRPGGSSYKTAITVEYDLSSENCQLGGMIPGVAIDDIDAYAQSAVSGWMESLGHRKNILNSNWDEIGVGVYSEKNGRMVLVQLFIKK